jgi:hypothetical protein
MLTRLADSSLNCRVGSKTAAYLIGELGDPAGFHSAGALASYVGVVLRPAAVGEAAILRHRRNPADSCFAIGVQTLIKRLHESGRLKSVDERRGKLRVRRMIDGRRLEVLHLPADAPELFPRPHCLLDFPPFPSIPDNVTVDDFDKWTAGIVRGAWKVIATAAEVSLATLYAMATTRARVELACAKAERKRVRTQLDRGRRLRLLPGSHDLEIIGRYESHIERGINRALHELQRLRAARVGLRRDGSP